MDRPTVALYEARAADWERARPPRRLAEARAFGRRAEPGPRLDVGCGTGRYANVIGGPRREPVVAVDAATAMLELARRNAPRALPVRADLELLPFRDRTFSGAWANMSYLHVARPRLPLALARLHWALRPGAAAEIAVLPGDYEGHDLPGDDFPGRFFAGWEPDALMDVVTGAGFAVDAIDLAGDRVRVRATRQRSLPDTVAAGMTLLVCGLNPSLFAADRGVPFARPGNRFWPAAMAAGLVTKDRDPLHALASGVGMTDLVKRATAGAAELRRDEYRAGVTRVERLVAWLRPGAVCFVGLAGWRAAVHRAATPGIQPTPLAGVPVYVMPSTSGLNARTPIAELADHLHRAFELGLENAAQLT